MWGKRIGRVLNLAHGQGLESPELENEELSKAFV